MKNEPRGQVERPAESRVPRRGGRVWGRRSGFRHARRITTEVCDHLAPGYLKKEIDRLRFEP
jgi:hypothetical protein